MWRAGWLAWWDGATCGYVDYVDFRICGLRGYMDLWPWVFKNYTWSWGPPRTGLSISQCCGGDLHLDVLDFFGNQKSMRLLFTKIEVNVDDKRILNFSIFQCNLSPFSSQLCGSHSLRISDVYEKVFRFPLNFDPHTCAKSLLVTLSTCTHHSWDGRTARQAQPTPHSPTFGICSCGGKDI